MDQAASALLARRLDRLRAGAVPSASTRVDAPRAVPAPSVDRAGRLARALGGDVLRGRDGSVVVLEARGALPLARGPLARLPDAVGTDVPLVCLDTETTGLGTAAGTVAFLVGLGWWEGDRFVVRQLLLPDHGDEPALLAALGDALPPDAWLVTYNGRSFDWPLLATRFRLHHLPPPSHAGHLDLLPLARQLWRHRLPDARLASVEHGVAGIRRADDLPGALIPERYFRFLRDGDGSLLGDVVRHNRQDVASLARLLAVLAGTLERSSDGSATHPGDLAGLGRAYLRRRRYADALGCFEAALPHAPRAPDPDPWRATLAERLAHDRARTLSRLGRHADASVAWLLLAEEGGRLAAMAWIQVAKHREHRERDPVGALRASVAAWRAARTSSPSHARWVARDLEQRVARLRRATVTPGEGPAA
jgi:hypothetical protein